MRSPRPGTSLARPHARGAALAAFAAFALLAPVAWSSSPPESSSGGALLDDPSSERLRQLGLMFDLGTVDGGMLSLVYRPSPGLRMYGGAGTNGAAPGVRLGAAVAPLRQRGFALNLDGGHFFPGNVNGIFSAFAGTDYDDSYLLEHFDYNFMNLQAGWEIERGGLMFFARGGVAFVWSQLPSQGIERVRHLSSLVDPDGSVEAFMPSIRVGLIGFL